MIVGPWKGAGAMRRQECTLSVLSSCDVPVAYIWWTPSPGLKVYRSPGRVAEYEVSFPGKRIGARSYDHALTLAAMLLRREAGR